MINYLLKGIIPVTAMILLNAANGQNTMTFTFTGINNTAYLQLDSIRVKNLSQGTDTLLCYPDTTLIVYPVGINEKKETVEIFKLMQNFPNPVEDKTIINMYVRERNKLCLIVANILGQQIINSEITLEKGYHSFRFTPGKDEIYLFTAIGNGDRITIKILHPVHRNSGHCLLEYLGSEEYIPSFKCSSAIREFLFSPGDELMLIGYADSSESGFLDKPETNQDYVFQFASNIPCPGMDSLNYEGQWYHTIQVFSQCWMKENLNAGIMIHSSQAQTDNGIIEKYCMGDDEYYCNISGGLYFWDEMMSYLYANEDQGICPEGWHVPGDLDWQILEGAVDFEYEIGDPAWGMNSWRGADAGGNLKEKGTSNWAYPNTGATNAFSFTALPGGYFVQNAFWGVGYKAYFWSSHPTQKYYRNMDWNQALIQRYAGGSNAAFSVRCIRD